MHPKQFQHVQSLWVFCLFIDLRNRIRIQILCFCNLHCPLLVDFYKYTSADTCLAWSWLFAVWATSKIPTPTPHRFFPLILFPGWKHHALITAVWECNLSLEKQSGPEGRRKSWNEKAEVFRVRSDGHMASCGRGNGLCLATFQQRQSHPWHNNTQPHHHGNSVGCRPDLSRPWPCLPPCSLKNLLTWCSYELYGVCFFFFFFMLSYREHHGCLSTADPNGFYCRWTTDDIVKLTCLNTGLWD